MNIEAIKQKKIVLSKNIILVKEDDEAIAYNQQNEEVHVLNETGVSICQFVEQEHKAIDEIIKMISENYDIKGIENWEEMILSFIEQLISKSVILISD